MRRLPLLFFGLVVLAAMLAGTLLMHGGAPAVAAGSQTGTVGAGTSTFAIIGDYGMDDANELAVANLVKSWSPSYILAAGDDYYDPAGGSGDTQYDESTGAYYGPWLKDVTTSGTRNTSPAPAMNAFFPAMGNHDYSDATPAPSTYTNYFKLPGDGFTSSSGNERYYDFVEGSVHVFVLNSNSVEPDGTSSTSKQATWLKNGLAASTSTWNVVLDHHPPYSSDASHGSSVYMQWPFAEWGADVVISGHAHTYERIMANGIVYFVNGIGGAARYSFTTPVTGSVYRYSANWGAQKVTVSDDAMVFDFYSVDNVLRDSYTLTYSAPAAPTTLTATTVSTSQIRLNWTDASDNETGFKVEKDVAGTWTQIATVGAGVTTYTDSGLSAGMAYSYRVRATNAVGDSAYSNVATGATQVQATVHVGDLDGTKSATKKAWTAGATVLVHTAGEAIVPSAVVTIGYTKYDAGGGVVGSGTLSATTTTRGIATVSLKSLSLTGVARMVFTVSNITKSGYLYTRALNHDIDFGTDGTTVTVAK